MKGFPKFTIRGHSRSLKRYLQVGLFKFMLVFYIKLLSILYNLYGIFASLYKMITFPSRSFYTPMSPSHNEKLTKQDSILRELHACKLHVTTWCTFKTLKDFHKFKPLMKFTAEFCTGHSRYWAPEEQPHKVPSAGMILYDPQDQTNLPSANNSSLNNVAYILILVIIKSQYHLVCKLCVSTISHYMWLPHAVLVTKTLGW